MLLVFIFFMRQNRKCIAFWRERAWYQLCNFSGTACPISMFYFLRVLLVDAVSLIKYCTLNLDNGWSNLANNEYSTGTKRVEKVLKLP